MQRRFSTARICRSNEEFISACAQHEWHRIMMQKVFGLFNASMGFGLFLLKHFSGWSQRPGGLEAFNERSRRKICLSSKSSRWVISWKIVQAIRLWASVLVHLTSSDYSSFYLHLNTFCALLNKLLSLCNYDSSLFYIVPSVEHIQKHREIWAEIKFN